MAGPNWKASFGTAFLAAAPGVLFLVFPARYLMETVTVAILVIGCVGAHALSAALLPIWPSPCSPLLPLRCLIPLSTSSSRGIAPLRPSKPN